MSREARQAGFGLLETVVAVAILALALPLLLGIVEAAVTRLSAAERQDAAWRLANDLMTEATASLDGGVGTREGRDGDLAWRVETVTAGDDAAGKGAAAVRAGLFRIRVTVRRADGRGSGLPVTLDTLKLRDGLP